ncbi:peptide-methionine (S)-S-oxide reductase [Micromonospora sp. U56]|nr:peptide-methionine (S)-S-oxide reductase [Micromonospora sp. U56]
MTTDKAPLAGGCFWGVEELYRHPPGVGSTRAGPRRRGRPGRGASRMGAALSGTGAERDVASDWLHEMPVRAALREVRRCATRSPVTDVAHQAASDAMVAILAKLATFRGKSRFTTWALPFCRALPTCERRCAEASLSLPHAARVPRL